jgi:hypothetical protein
MALPILARLGIGSLIRSEDKEAPQIGSPLSMDMTFDSKALEAKLRKIERQMPKKLDDALHATAGLGVQIIKKRTAKGIGYKGTFAPYSARYAQHKTEERGGTAKPNLFYTGRMLGSLQNFKGRAEATIGFTRATESKKAFFNNKTRPFMGFTRNEKDRLINFMKKRLFK